MAGLSRLGVGLDSVLGRDELGGLEKEQESEEEEEDGMDTAPAQDYADITEVYEVSKHYFSNSVW